MSSYGVYPGSTEDIVSQQAEFSFSKNTLNFKNNALVRRIEIDPAIMVPQREGLEPFPGLVRIFFVEEVALGEKMELKQSLLDQQLGEVSGRASNGWLLVTPFDGVVTHTYMGNVLAGLFAAGALTMGEAEWAANFFGIEAPRFAKGPSFPVRAESVKKLDPYVVRSLMERSATKHEIEVIQPTRKNAPPQAKPEF